MRIQVITYLFVLFAAACMPVRASDAPVAVDGVLDLRNYSFSAGGAIDLKGEFEFYWNQMLNPSLGGERGEMTIIDVPRSWHKMKQEIPEIEHYGYASYRLTILLPAGISELTFRVENVYSASAYFLNGKAIGYIGFPGTNKYQHVSRFNSAIFRGAVEAGEVELIVRVSNFDNRLSGILGGITMGTYEQISQVRNTELNRGHFLIGAFLIVGIYFLGLFLIRTERYRLYFSMLCFLMALRVIMLTEIPFLDRLNMNPLTMARVDYLNIYLFAPFFTLMIRSLFPYEFPKFVFRVIMWVSLVFLLVVIFLPLSLFTYSLPIFFIVFLGISLVFTYVISLAWVRGRSHAPAFTMGLVVLFLGTLNDMLNEIDVIQTGHIVHYTMFIYLLIYAYIFADKSNFLQKKSENLASELNLVKNNLEDLVEERTTELQNLSGLLEKQKKKLESTNKDLMESIDARNRLFSIIGHDVKAPIGYNRQALELLIEGKDITEEQHAEMLKMMASSSEATYNLLDNLLVWGRSQTGKLKTTIVSVRIKDLVQESLDLLNMGLREKHLRVEDYVSETHLVEADRDQLFIVIRNLLSNAMKFTPEKGSIYLSSKKQKGEIHFSVRDTGIGIPESIQDKLLDSLSHVSTQGTRGEKGSGLGLKICQEIVQTNGGKMKIEGSSGQGTTVTVRLPAGQKTSKKK